MINPELLHFMRPLFLLGLPLVAIVWWLVRRRATRKPAAAELVAPHLCEALTVNSNARTAITPIDSIGIALAAAVIAAAGPAWSKQRSPWFSETAPLVIAMEVSNSMRSNDLQPTRLDRARFEVLDLIERRSGSRIALIAYAGSAHIVMPPSRDVDVIKPFLESLDPAIMPVPGINAGSVLPLAQEMLAEEATGGTLMFVSDGFAAVDVPALAEYTSRTDSASVVALIVGSDEGGVALMPDGSAIMDSGGERLNTSIDTGVLSRIQSEAGVPVVRAAAGSRDVQQLMRHIESNFRQADDPNARWQDQAWWFVWPAALLTLLWFRRGWTMQW